MLQAVEIKRADAAELRLRYGAVWCSVVHGGVCVALCCRVVQSVAECCSALQAAEVEEPMQLAYRI